MILFIKESDGDKPVNINAFDIEQMVESPISTRGLNMIKHGYNVRHGWSSSEESFLESLVEDMVLWWDMQDTGNTLTDLSGNNQIGAVTNGANSTVEGRNWKYFAQENPFGYVRTLNLPSLTNYVIGGVYKPYTASSGTQRFFGVNSGFKLDMGLDVANGGNGNDIYMYPVSGAWADTTIDINSGSPMMIFVDCDGSNTYIYVNGVKQKTFTGTHNSIDGNAKFGSSEGFDDYLKCYIGMILVTNKSLSESEHLQLFNEEKTKYGIS